MSDTSDAAGVYAGRKKFVVGGIIIGVCVAALLYGATKLMSLDFYDSVSGFLEKADTYQGKTIRLRGIVEKGSVQHDFATLHTEFILADNDASLRVFYKGTLSSSFEPGKDLVVQGVYDKDRKLLVASDLMYKCPSKYESERGAY